VGLNVGVSFQLSSLHANLTNYSKAVFSLCN